MKKLSLLFMSLIAAIGMSAQGSADLGTMTSPQDVKDNVYGTKTSTAGWKATNAQLIKVNEKACPVLNGKTSTVGTLTSPETPLTGGIGTLSLQYLNNYKESNGVSIKIEIIKDGATVKTETLTVANSKVTKGTVYDYTTPELNVEGDFSIKITNLCPTSSTSNADRVGIASLTWTGYTPAEEPTPAEEHYVLLKNTSSWATPCVWAWNDNGNCNATGTWAGDAMTLVEGETDLYRRDVPEGKEVPTMIIFSNDGADQSSNGDAYVDKQTYDCNGNKYEEGVAPTEYTIYFDNSASNWEQVYAYAYPGNPLKEWKGTEMTEIDAKTGYFKLPTKKNIVGANIIFHNGEGTQTGDGVIVVDNGVYKYSTIPAEVYVGLYGEIGGDEPVPPTPPTVDCPETLMAIYTPWWTNTTVMEKADNTFTATGIEISNEGYIQFCTNTEATDWPSADNNIDLGTRYAAKDEASQKLTLVDGVATAPLTKGSDKAFNVGEGTFDVKVEFTAEGATMTITKTAEPAPVIPENLLIHHNGQVENGGWTHEGIKMDPAEDSSFSISELDLSSPKDGGDDSYFHFSSNPEATSWEDLGARYGAAEADMPLEFNEAGTAEAELTKQIQPNAFMVKPGKYDMTVKFNPDGTARMTVTDKSSAITAIGADSKADVKVEYYNLQGMKVENPAAGIYIRRAGDEVSKVAL